MISSWYYIDISGWSGIKEGKILWPTFGLLAQKWVNIKWVTISFPTVPRKVLLYRWPKGNYLIHRGHASTTPGFSLSCPPHSCPKRRGVSSGTEPALPFGFSKRSFLWFGKGFGDQPFLEDVSLSLRIEALPWGCKLSLMDSSFSLRIPAFPQGFKLVLEDFSFSFMVWAFP